MARRVSLIVFRLLSSLLLQPGNGRIKIGLDDEKLMYYVYVLQSKVDKNLYIGVTADLKNRFRRHNAGKVKSTKSRKPFILVYYEAYKDKRDATKREYHLKTSQQRELLKERLKHSLVK